MKRASLLFFACASALALGGCSDDPQCVIDTDCDLYQRCSDEGRCVDLREDAGATDGGAGEGGVDAGEEDAGPEDAGVDAGPGMIGTGSVTAVSQGLSSGGVAVASY
ncbi:MAG TPA: hypothetical protein RMH26_05545, partial [Polyangiaceae bacterium LLY-WYZ-15_(1-7)]|nr:hypothetical protein [Polyangiaceae bacterium LLY-WYZ-15_(1-7)]